MRVVTFALSAPLRRAVAVIAAVTLLLAQWAGHTHRIEHPHDLEERVALAWSVLADPARADERALRAERAWTVAAAALAYQSRAPPRA